MDHIISAFQYFDCHLFQVEIVGSGEECFRLAARKSDDAFIEFRKLSSEVTAKTLLDNRYPRFSPLVG